MHSLHVLFHLILALKSLATLDANKVLSFRVPERRSHESVPIKKGLKRGLLHHVSLEFVGTSESFGAGLALKLFLGVKSTNVLANQ